MKFVKEILQLGLPVECWMYQEIHCKIVFGRVPEGPRLNRTLFLLWIGKILVEWLTDLVKCGFPRKTDDLLNSVQKIVLSDNRKTPFNDGRPKKSGIIYS